VIDDVKGSTKLFAKHCQASPRVVAVFVLNGRSRLKGLTKRHAPDLTPNCRSRNFLLNTQLSSLAY
jgi:hypothetical protein